MSVLMSCLRANRAVSRMVSAVSESAPSTNMPCVLMPYLRSVPRARTMSATLCDLSKPSSVSWLTDSRPSATRSQPESRMSPRSSGSETTSVRTCADHEIFRPLAIIMRSSVLSRRLSAAKLSS